MRQFKVIHLGAGPFPHGAEITDEEIRAAGFDADAWLKAGAISEMTAKAAKPLRPTSPQASRVALPAAAQQNAAG